MLLETTQRRLCRVLFVLGCVLPTLAVGGYAAQRLLPGYDAALLAAAGERLGAAVACDRLETPRPGVYELHGVRLGDVATCDRLRLSRDGDGWRLSAATMRVADLADAANLVDRWRAGGETLDARVGRLEYEGAAAGLERVRVAVADGELALSDQADFRVVATGEGLRLETGGRAAPLAWLPPTPIAPAWAESIDFVGVIDTVRHADEPTSGTATGEFRAKRVAIDGLEAAHGALADADLAWRGDRVERFAGRLTLDEGRLAQPRVYGVAAWLSMRPSDELQRRWDATPRPDWFAFDDAACDVLLDAEGLRLTSGGPIVSHEGAALLAPPDRVLPASRLVQAWFPDDPAELPARAAAVEMASRLPGESAPR